MTGLPDESPEKAEDFSEFYEAIGLTGDGEYKEEMIPNETPVVDTREWVVRVNIEATIDKFLGNGKVIKEVVRRETTEIVNTVRLNEIIECAEPKP